MVLEKNVQESDDERIRREKDERLAELAREAHENIRRNGRVIRDRCDVSGKPSPPAGSTARDRQA